MLNDIVVRNLLQAAIQASVKAGAHIMRVYNSNDFQVNLKSDKTPLTLADRLAHNEIKASLGKTYIPLLSEEGRDIRYEERMSWEYFWIVDPLDGTKEFIKRNGEFTVNIALMQSGYPVLGVIYVPVTRELYFSTSSMGAYKVDRVDYDSEQPVTLDMLQSGAKPLPFGSRDDRLVVVVSRSHTSAETHQLIEQLARKYPNLVPVPKGSSLKMCLVAEGKADIYPRLSHSMEWDTAAGQAIVEGAGFQVVTFNGGERLRYNKEELLNPWFVVLNPQRINL